MYLVPEAACNGKTGAISTASMLPLAADSVSSLRAAARVERSSTSGIIVLPVVGPGSELVRVCGYFVCTALIFYEIYCQIDGITLDTAVLCRRVPHTTTLVCDRSLCVHMWQCAVATYLFKSMPV